MNILFVSAVLPYPLHSGGQIRIYNLLKRLGEKHEITLCAFIRHSSELQYLKEFPFCRYVYMIYRGSAWQPQYLIRSLVGKYPFLLSTYHNQAMKNMISGLLKKNSYDLLHLEPFYVWPSVPKTHLPIVVGEHNIEYEVYQQYVRRFLAVPLRPLLYLDTLKLRFWEEVIWKKAHTITAVSEHDERVIRRCNKKVYRVPNGVDLVEFPFREKRQSNEGPVLLFVGDFKWLPNRDSSKQLIFDIWPLLKERFPGVTLRIIGRNIPKNLKKQAETLGATVVGEVSDIAKEYQSADILLAPVTIGGGTKFKMLEAMASGLPVITTQAGMQGLGTVAGVHYLEAATPEEFVTQTVEIWENTRLRNTITKSARKLVEEKYGWDSIAQNLDSVWRQTYEENH